MNKEVHRWTRASNYAGAEWHGYFSSGFGCSRDSDALEASNFQVAWRELDALNSDHPTEDERTVQIVHEGHWAVGWVDWIAIHESNIAAYQRALELCASYNNYPVLDESHFSDLEYTRAMDYWDSMSLNSKVQFCADCKVSIFAARRGHDLPDRLWEALTA